MFLHIVHSSNMCSLRLFPVSGPGVCGEAQHPEAVLPSGSSVGRPFPVEVLLLPLIVLKRHHLFEAECLTLDVLGRLLCVSKTPV